LSIIPLNILRGSESNRGASGSIMAMCYSCFSRFPTGFYSPKGVRGTCRFRSNNIQDRQCTREDSSTLTTAHLLSGPIPLHTWGLTYVNLIVKDANLTGILDWDASRYFFVRWEFTCAGICLEKEDYECWRALKTSGSLWDAGGTLIGSTMDEGY
jgi:hypothetical protein